MEKKKGCKWERCVFLKRCVLLKRRQRKKEAFGFFLFFRQNFTAKAIHYGSLKEEVMLEFSTSCRKVHYSSCCQIPCLKVSHPVLHIDIGILNQFFNRLSMSGVRRSGSPGLAYFFLTSTRWLPMYENQNPVTISHQKCYQIYLWPFQISKIIFLPNVSFIYQSVPKVHINE